MTTNDNKDGGVTPLNPSKTPGLDRIRDRVNEDVWDLNSRELRECWTDSLTIEDLLDDQASHIEILEESLGDAGDSDASEAENLIAEAREAMDQATIEATVDTDDLVTRLKRMIEWRSIEKVEEAMAEAVRQLRKGRVTEP